MNTPWTASRIRHAKGRQKLACLTAGDFTTARLLDAAGIPLVLVGDSLAMTMLGYDTTLPVTVDEMLHHTRAVARGVSHALVVADMPFLSYQVSHSRALENAGRFIKEGGAGAVKIEGGAIRAALVQDLTENGIPVLGHIGLTPQSVREKGYRVEGRDDETAGRVIEDARALAEAGAFAIVIECVPATLGGRITQAVPVPTIGIGAGADCDGQILVTHDLLGLFPDLSPKFVKQYAQLGERIARALDSYRDEVESGAFPDPEHTY